MFGFMVSIIVCAIAIGTGNKKLAKMDHDIETKIYDIDFHDSFIEKLYKGYNNGVYAAENYVKAYSNDLLLGRRKIVENEVRYKDLIGWKIFAPTEYNSLLYLDNGYLAGANKKETPEVIHSIASKIKSLKDTAEESGAIFFYMQTPGNINKYGDPEINNIKDYANYNADRLLVDLRNYEIPCLDLRENIEATFEDYHSLFFRNDHHWRQPVSLWATNEMCKYMEEKYALPYDDSFYDESMYDIEVKKEHYLGSLGRKATLAAVTPDDFELMHPKFDTYFHFKLDNKDVDKTGDWEIMYDYEEINYEDIYWRECYLGLLSFYETAHAVIENPYAEQDKYVLLVADSLTIPMSAFLSLNYKRVELIDPRYYKPSIKEYIKETKPDIVISSYSTTIIQDFYRSFDFD